MTSRASGSPDGTRCGMEHHRERLPRAIGVASRVSDDIVAGVREADARDIRRRYERQATRLSAASGTRPS